MKLLKKVQNYRYAFAGAVATGWLVAVSAVANDAESPPVVEATDRVQINETVTDGFIHPGIGLTKEILENARAQVLAKRDPWYSGFQKLAAHRNSSTSVSCRNQKKEGSYTPDSDTFNSRGMDARLKQDADKAYRQALMYYFTGDMAYRANAMNIIRVWSQMDDDKYEAYSEVYIHASYPVKDLIMAAELMRYTDSPDAKLAWSEQDTKDFTKNFVVPCVTIFFDGNGWFMNQNGYPLAAAMSGDIFLSDRQNYEKRVEWFTVCKDAPNKGWNSSIKHLARLVETNALTGEAVAEPQVQVMEMGRDQAHAGDDMEIFNNTSRMMIAQGTKVDPETGTLSTTAEAVGPYEFLNDRILAATDYFCRFMLGYDTPWIPAVCDMGPNGEIRQVYPRIADNYRGRIREHDFWDLYYYYTDKGVNVAEKAPYYYEAFTKRIVSSDVEWIFIPKGATGEGARVPQTVQEPDVVEVEERSTGLDGNSSVMQEGSNVFRRVVCSEAGSRIALLSMGTGSKTVGLRIRTTGVANLEMSGFEKPWLMPNTQGEWRYVAYTMPAIEHFGDIVFILVKGSPETTVDFDQVLRKPDELPTPPVFVSGNEPVRAVAYAGAAVSLDFSATGAGEQIVYESLDKPDGSVLDSQTGAFSWTPGETGEYSFVAMAADGKTITPKKVTVEVAADRTAAMEAIKAAYDPDTAYVKKSLDHCTEIYGKVARAAANGASDAVFWKGLVLLQQAFDDLEVLTPLLPDGSMDFTKTVVESDIGDSIGLLIDGNDDTFPVYYLAKDMDYIFDFGPDFEVSFTAFALEGRLNFEKRVDNTVFYGSNNQKKWTELTPEHIGMATELSRVEVPENRQEKKFRYLRIKKEASGLFEPSELRIYGKRYEVN